MKKKWRKKWKIEDFPIFWSNFCKIHSPFVVFQAGCFTLWRNSENGRRAKIWPSNAWRNPWSTIKTTARRGTLWAAVTRPCVACTTRSLPTDLPLISQRRTRIPGARLGKHTPLLLNLLLLFSNVCRTKVLWGTVLAWDCQSWIVKFMCLACLLRSAVAASLEKLTHSRILFRIFFLF